MQLFHKKSILRLCYKWLKKTTTFAILEKCIEKKTRMSDGRYEKMETTYDVDRRKL